MEKPKSQDDPHRLEIGFGTPIPSNPNPQIEMKRHLLPDSSSNENPTPTTNTYYHEGFTPFDEFFAEFVEELKAKRMKMTVEEEKSSSSSSYSSSPSPTSTLHKEASSILSSLGKGHRLVLLKPPPHLLPSAEARLSWAVDDLKQLLQTPPLPLSGKLKLTPPPTPTPPSAQTETPPRISKLKRILRILKNIDSCLRVDSSSSPPTREEQRLYNLIDSHVNAYITLFYREDFLLCRNGINLPLLTIGVKTHIAAAAAAAAKEDDGADDGKEKQQEEELDDAQLVVDKLWDMSSEYCYKLEEFLEECRPSIIPPEEDPLCRPRCQGAAIDNTKSLQRKQRLLNILFHLEEIGRSRDYAPPLKGQEIECYKKIRDQVTCSLLFIAANIQLQRIAGTPATCIWAHVSEAWHHSNCYVPHGHRFALAFDAMPLFRSLVKQCKHLVSRIFSTAETTASYQSKQSTPEDEEEEEEEEEEVDVDVHDNNDNDIDMGGVDTRAVVMKSRLECLRTIVKRFIRIGSSPGNPPFPTDEEVRLYAQIAEHVDSSLWLFGNSTDAERIAGAAFHEVDVTSMRQPHPSSSAALATKGNYKSTRERCLMEIVSYINAMKSSCLDAVPTEEEVIYYKMLSEGLDYSFMSCPVAADHGVEGQDSEEEIASLKSQLVSIYKSELNFLDEVKEETARLINMVRCAIMPEEGEAAPCEDAFNWLDKNKVQLADKLKVFFSGKCEQLDQLIVMSEEMACLLPSIVDRLHDATKDAGGRFHYRKEYAIVARELQMARHIMDKMNHPISGTT